MLYRLLHTAIAHCNHSSCGFSSDWVYGSRLRLLPTGISDKRSSNGHVRLRLRPPNGFFFFYFAIEFPLSPAIVVPVSIVIYGNASSTQELISHLLLSREQQGRKETMATATTTSTAQPWDMFYMADPRRHMYRDVKHVPHHLYAQVNRVE